MAPSDEFVVTAPLQGTVVSVPEVGSSVAAGRAVAMIESMKMEHPVEAPRAGTVMAVHVEVGATVHPGDPLVTLGLALVPAGSDGGSEGASAAGPGEEDGADDAGLRADLAAVAERHAIGLDAHRPEAVAKRHARGQRTARENVEDLCDPGSFVEYGPLVIAAQRRRRPVEELIERTPADGLVGGIGTIDGRRVVVLSYDYLVLAGTQGMQNHRKKDRLFELAERLRLPVVFFTEGGGGRPGDTDANGVSGLDTLAFHLFARLSGLVPLVGIAAGRCFAGNAAILGMCDVIIATADATIGMGGPAMIEGGGLGVVTPEEVGPMSVQVPNGVVDVAVADEAEAVAVAKRYLSYFADADPRAGASGGPTGADLVAPDLVPPVAEAGARSRSWDRPDPLALRDLIPENRRQPYEVRRVVEGLADSASVLELRAGFGAGIVTALIRVEGRPLGVVANNPMHLGGAIDADGADKASRFLQLCDAFDLPVLFLCDTPGIMVGPEAEATALVRHVNRLFLAGANLTVPYGTIILRKAYGLGAQAMAGGSFKAPVFCVAWPTGELGGMGLEGAVKLGYRRELEAIEDPTEREALFDQLVARAYEHGKALSTATYFEIDDVIDPADSARWITTMLESAPPPPPRTGKKRPHLDAW